MRDQTTTPINTQRGRLPFGPFAGAPLSMVPDAHLTLIGALAHGKLRCAVLDELELRRGSDRSGPRLKSWAPAWDGA